LLLPLARSEGLTDSLENFKAVFAELEEILKDKDTEAMSEEELESVAGGNNIIWKGFIDGGRLFLNWLRKIGLNENF